MERKINTRKKDKKEIIENTVAEKWRLHNNLIEKEHYKILIELEKTIKDLTWVLKEFRDHQFLEIHRSKWKIVLYNLSLWILFAIWTVFWLLLISWFTYHFLKDSEAIKQVVDNQLKIRQFDIQNIKEKIKTEIKTEQTETGSTKK